MKLFVLSNRIQADSNPPNAQYDLKNRTDFTCNLNEVYEIPPNSQVCLNAVSCNDNQADPTLYYVQLPTLGVKSCMGNGGKGDQQAVIGCFQSDLQNDLYPMWVDLDNPAPIKITDLRVRITDSLGAVAQGFTGETQVVIYMRQKKMKC